MARTEARLDPTRAVTRRRSGGAWEKVTPRTDWARVDATAEAEIEPQAAVDDAEAAKNAAAWGAARSPARRAVAMEFAAPDRLIGGDTARLGTGQARAQRAARALLRVIDRVPEAVLALRAS